MKFNYSSSLSFLAVLAVLLLSSARPAQAQGPVGTSKNLGIGVEFGHGAGLSVKYAATPSSAWQFGLDGHDYGRYRTYYKDHGRYYYAYNYGFDSASYLIHAEYLATQGNLVRSAAVTLPWYAGGGLDVGVGAGTALAVHGNLGLAMQFTRAPIDLFVEWTPRVWLVDFVQLQLIGFNSGVRVWF